MGSWTLAVILLLRKTFVVGSNHLIHQELDTPQPPMDEDDENTDVATFEEAAKAESSEERATAAEAKEEAEKNKEFTD